MHARAEPLGEPVPEFAGELDEPGPNSFSGMWIDLAISLRIAEKRRDRDALKRKGNAGGVRIIEALRQLEGARASTELLTAVIPPRTRTPLDRAAGAASSRAARPE